MTRVRARHCAMTRRHLHAPTSMCLGYILRDFVRLLREYVYMYVYVLACACVYVRLCVYVGSGLPYTPQSIT